MEKFISILIPTYNGGNDLIELIKRLKKQRLPLGWGMEIILVDSSSTDGSIKKLEELHPEITVKIISQKDFDHGGTRNKLANLSTGDLLLFMTQDAIPVDDNLLIELAESLDSELIKISYARQIPKSDASILEKFARNFNYPDKTLIKNKDSIKELGIKTFFNSNVCSMYKSELFYGANKGFPEKIILNEDMIMASSVILDGYSVIYNGNAKVYHSHNYNLIQQFKRNFDIGMAFNETKYLLDFASTEKEGWKMVKKQLEYLVSQKQFTKVFSAFVENISKFCGYKLGKMHRMLPKKIVKSFSAYTK